MILIYRAGVVRLRLPIEGRVASEVLLRACAPSVGYPHISLKSVVAEAAEQSEHV